MSEPPVQLEPAVAAVFARLDEIGYTHRDLARILDIDPTKVSKVWRGKRRMTAHELETARDALRMDEVPVAETRMIPVIGLVQAGQWREEISAGNALDYIPCPDPRLAKQVFAIRVTGDSMDKVAADGTLIVVNPNDRQLISGQYYVVGNGDGETTFKLFQNDPARLEPRSNNPAHKPILLGEHPIEIVGRVVMTANWL